jgi:hypothetical protein
MADRVRNINVFIIISKYLGLQFRLNSTQNLKDLNTLEVRLVFKTIVFKLHSI